MEIIKIIKPEDGWLAKLVMEKEFGGIKIPGVSADVADKHFNNEDYGMEPLDELSIVEYVPVLKENEVLEIEEKLGYTFKNKKYIHRAFSHPSYDFENNYEVFEFIGDRVLDVIITKLIYECVINENLGIKEDEGCLSELKTELVRGSNLARLSEKLELTKYLAVYAAGNKAARDEIRNQDSVKENLYEAVIGAVALDTNWDFSVLEQLVKRIHDYRIGVYQFSLQVAERKLYKLRKTLINIEEEFIYSKKTEKEKLDRAVNFLQELYQKNLLTVLHYYMHEERDNTGNPVWWCVGHGAYEWQDIGWACMASTKLESKKLCAVAMISRLYKELRKKFIANANDVNELQRNIHMEVMKNGRH